MPRTADQYLSAPQVPGDNYVHASVYTDPELYEEEKENILRRTWKFVCHISELAEVGDYRTHTWTGIPLVTVRSTEDKISTFVNSCSHRGAKIVRDPAGNMKHMTCFFHLWEYDLLGNCTYQTRDEAYEAHGPAKKDLGLHEVRTDVFAGLVFMNYDGEAMSLRDYIGDAGEPFEDIFNQYDLEVFHYNQTHVRGNWKAWYLTNCDLYHEWGHLVNRTTSVLAPGYHDRPWRLNPEGHGYNANLLDGSPFQVQYKKYKGWQNRDDLVFKGLAPGEFRVIDIFPNLSVFFRATCIRLNHSTPLAPGHTLMEERGLGVKGESKEDRKVRSKQFVQIWGPFSRNASEDCAYVEATHECQEHGANPYDLMSRLELLEDNVHERAHSDTYLRHFFNKWGEYMGRPANNPKNFMTAAE
jgi:methanesulfonate monooxygenase large subunit